MKRQEKMNNKGFSLMELVVVIALLGIISVGGLVTMGLLFSASGKEASAKLNSALIKTRTESMSKASASVEIYEDTDSKYYVAYTISGNRQDPIMIGDTRVEISYEDSNGSTKNITSGGNKLELSFERDTGAFKPIGSDAGNLPMYCKKITVVSGHKTYVITCERLTGKTFVK